MTSKGTAAVNTQQFTNVQQADDHPFNYDLRPAEQTVCRRCTVVYHHSAKNRRHKPVIEMQE